MKQPSMQSLLVLIGLFEGGCECIYFIQGELRIIYLLQEGMSRKQRSLTEGSGYLDVSIVLRRTPSVKMCPKYGDRKGVAALMLVSNL